ncbi:MAG TPA: hypothetical protein VHI52_23260 [Verrucomicrobiae bacterium]|nr:hypothetical protein [Verrucomicrobiae bacterium]
MKKRSLAMLALAWAVSSPGQGTVMLSNLGTGVNAPVYLGDGITRPSTGYTVELLAGPSLSEMRSVSTTGFLVGGPGYFNGGAVTISNVAPGATAFCVVQVWLNQYGDYTNACKSGTGNSCGNCLPFKVVLGGFGMPPSSPAPMTGLNAFSLTPLPAATTSRLQLSGSNNVVLSWAFPEPIWRFSVQESSKLGPASWLPVTNAIDVNGGVFSVQLPAVKGKAFFQVSGFQF